MSYKNPSPPIPVPESPAAPPAPSPEGDIAVPRGGFPVVGIGASAGGLAAFEAFFSGMPATTDPGMAFVLVQHLAPDHKSILSDLIRHYTRMQVFEVQDGMVLQPNCAYIIPPNRDMGFEEGTLRLYEPTLPRGQRLPIDFFFRTLAHELHERAICIVLSGTGSDGTQGVRAIKAEGGMVMVQNPASTEYDGMPRSAIATGLVDFEMPPAEMPAQLMAYVSQAFGRLPRRFGDTSPPAGDAARKVFMLLRTRTGHDFSRYKPNTTHRRIERRMAVQQVKSMEEYVRFLQQTPEEVEALFGDMLIGVTSFFRDPRVFQALETKVIPGLFAGKPADSPIRVWCVGCSTGEEAYSIAILISERMEALKQNYPVQIFATDIDPRAVATARAGIFPAGIAADVTPQRLARYFVPDADGNSYRIHKSIRDMLVISEQSVIKDPPFSRLDLISCRNLLIYLDAELQKKVLSVFHYALNPAGFLLLGFSETVGHFADLFDAEERKLKLFRRREHTPGARQPAMLSFVSTPNTRSPQTPTTSGRQAGPEKVPWREVIERALLQNLQLVAALVNNQGDLLYLHGRSGLYLEPAQGETGIPNILKMAREGLRYDMTTALHLADTGRERVLCPGLRVKDPVGHTVVDLGVYPLPRDAENTGGPLFLVVLQPVGGGPGRMSTLGEPLADSEAQARIAALQQQLEAKNDYLHATFEELEAANSELQSSNEEMQSVNEELQSTNEELETSKEELQSVNEELATVNVELQTKVTDLSHANNDMNNLLAGTGIGTVFVDRNLRIQRFTPAVTRIINLIQSDIGRPVGHIVSNLVGYDSLVTDAQAVLDQLIPQEREVRTRAGSNYTLRILPYRTLENVIEGVAITFVDITERKVVEATLRAQEIRLAEAIVATMREPLLVLDEELNVVLANRAYYSTFRAGAAETVGQHLFTCCKARWDLPALRRQMATVLEEKGKPRETALTLDMEAEGRGTLRIHARRLFSESGSSGKILMAIEELPEETTPNETGPADGAVTANTSGSIT